jgi:hypothetical protein
MSCWKIACLVLLALCTHVIAASAQSHYWYMVDPGNEKWFYDPATPGLYIHAYIPGEVIDGAQARYLERIYDGETVLLACGLVSNNTEGDVFVHGNCSLPTEPQLLIDSPLWVGKTWQRDQYTTAVVVGEEDHTGPFGGPFPCYIIEYENAGNIAQLWVSDGVGLVKEVIVEDGVEYEIVLYDAIIPVSRSTWGAVKELYR